MSNLPLVHDAVPPDGDNPACERCAFSEFVEGRDVGTCRANPPTAIIVPQKIQTLRGDEVVPMLQGVFPPVERTSFCHMFDDKETIPTH